MKISRVIRMILSIGLLVTGIGLLSVPYIRDWSMDHHVTQIERQIQDYTKQSSQESVPSKPLESTEEDKPIKTDGLNNKQIQDMMSKEDVWSTDVLSELYAEFQTYNQSLMTNGQSVTDVWAGFESSNVIGQYGLDALGVVEIPDMKVKLPLYLNSSTTNLAKGAAVVNGTSMPIGGVDTNSVIAAHRGWRGNAYFQYIDQMKAGSKVYIHTPWGKLTYQAVSVKIISPYDAGDIMIQKGKDMVTLMSCHPYVLGGGPQRYLVYCERTTDTANPNNAEETVSNVDEDVSWSETDGNKSDVDVGADIGPVDKEDNLLKLEILVQRYLPPLTLMFCGVIILVRARKGQRTG